MLMLITTVHSVSKKIITPTAILCTLVREGRAK
jgi:hypothetical protein